MYDLAEILGAEKTELNTFLGLPKGNIDHLDAAVAILGAPIATPYPGFGLFSASAPTAIRNATIYSAPTIGHYDFDIGGSLLDATYGRIVDCGNLDADENHGGINRARITGAVGKILDAGAKPLIIGGDDSVPTPVFEAFGRRGKKYTILQIDAHIDWRDEVNGERWGLSSTMRRASEMPHIEKIVQVGMRAAGSARRTEYEDALAWGANIITAQQLHREGLAGVLDLISADANVLVTFDCDALDAAIMPAVMSPNPGGLSYWQVVGILQGVAAKANFCGFNLVEFMASRDDKGGNSAHLASRLITNALALLAKIP
ncbi:MAG: arginase family protein [Candidatus Promineifilaceae bacterium]